MRNTFSVLFYIRRNRPRKDGRCPLSCRVTVSGESFTVSTHLWVEPARWSVERHRVRGRRVDDVAANRSLDSIRHTIYAHYYAVLQQFGVVTASLLLRRFRGEGEGGTVVEAFERHNQIFGYDVDVTRSRSTFNKYLCVENHMRRFLRQRMGREDVRMCDVDLRLIKEFEKYLRESGCSVNTISVYMMAFKKIVNSARRRGEIVCDPFAEYCFGHEPRRRGMLSLAELRRLSSLGGLSPSEELVRDIFLFCCFTGLSYSDVRSLTYSNIRRSFDNHLWVVTQRCKTRTTVRVRLLDAALVIMERYRSDEERVFSVPSNKQCNNVLRRLAHRACLSFVPTFHVARHTFATTVALANGVPIESIASMLGHTNIRTTQIYAAITDGKLSRDMEMLALKCRNSLPCPPHAGKANLAIC